jgi:hypothetical protein
MSNKILEEVSSMYTCNDANFVCDKLYFGANGGCDPSCNSIAQSYGRCSGHMSALFFSNTNSNA